jgi:SET domain.
MHFLIGYGIFTTRQFEAGQFLLEYPGELISKAEGIKRQKNYQPKDGSFVFYYQDKWYGS